MPGNDASNRRATEPRERRRRIGIVSITTSAVILLLGARALSPAAPLILSNTSPSEPEGLYLRTHEAPGVGRLASFMAPPSAASYIAVRRPDLRRVAILKALAAGPGSLVCARAGRLVIDGKAAAAIAARDRSGAPLPQWRGCRRLGAGEWFAYSGRAANSFDSRYYGPIRADQIGGTYRPLWVRDPAR